MLSGARGRCYLRTENGGAAEYHGAGTQSTHGGTGPGCIAMILVSDTSVLIDLERGGLLEALFTLPHEFAVPDVLYDHEMRGDWGDGLIRLGLRVEEVSKEGVANALRYRHQRATLSVPDSFALALAKEREWLLLTGDGQLRDLAAGE